MARAPPPPTGSSRTRTSCRDHLRRRPRGSIGWRGATWSLAILDEAQAIKNPGARQTRAIKRLRARARIALSGTPVENRLGDLWSLYDFLNPGLLGTAPEFGRCVKALAVRAASRLRAAAPPCAARTSCAA